MSISVMSRVWASSPREGKELLIELALADFADDAGRSWPAIETLAKKARCSERHVQATIRKMVEEGALRVDTGTGPYGTNLYTLLSGGVQSLHPAADDAGGAVSAGGVQSATEIKAPTSPDPSLEPSDHNRQEIRQLPARDPIATSTREGADRSTIVGSGGENATSARRGGDMDAFGRALLAQRVHPSILDRLASCEIGVIEGAVTLGIADSELYHEMLSSPLLGAAFQQAAEVAGYERCAVIKVA